MNARSAIVFKTMFGSLARLKNRRTLRCLFTRGRSSNWSMKAAIIKPDPEMKRMKKRWAALHQK